MRTAALLIGLGLGGIAYGLISTYRAECHSKDHKDGGWWVGAERGQDLYQACRDRDEHKRRFPTHAPKVYDHEEGSALAPCTKALPMQLRKGGTLDVVSNSSTVWKR
jgi:hypothetical protein